MKQRYLWVAAIALVVFTAVLFVRIPKGATMTDQTLSAHAESIVPAPPEMQIDVNKTYTATLVTTAGDFVIALTAKQTPKTVNNFVYLARKGFYDGTPFHRVIKGFMIQGGDPRGNGTGGPGYKFDDEPFTGEYVRGTVAMANSGPNTNGSQFFIMHQDYSLPHDYVIFGKVIEGLGIVDKIAAAEMIQDGYENSKPVKPVLVESVSIVEQ